MIVDQLPALRRLPEHRRLLEQAVALFREDARVVGLVVGGSLAHGQADFYSDVDLYVVVRDGRACEEVWGGRETVAQKVGKRIVGVDVDRDTDGDSEGGAPETLVVVRA